MEIKICLTLVVIAIGVAYVFVKKPDWVQAAKDKIASWKAK